MIRRIDLRGLLARGEAPDYRALVPRAPQDVESALAVVRPICDDVRDRGGAALRDYAARFDGVQLTDLRVPAAALDAYLDAYYEALVAHLGKHGYLVIEWMARLLGKDLPSEIAQMHQVRRLQGGADRDN